MSQAQQRIDHQGENMLVMEEKGSLVLDTINEQAIEAEEYEEPVRDEEDRLTFLFEVGFCKAYTLYFINYFTYSND